jgi:hypothetical protein
MVLQLCGAPSPAAALQEAWQVLALLLLLLASMPLGFWLV